MMLKTLTLYRIVNIDINDQSIMIDCMTTIVAIEGRM